MSNEPPPPYSYAAGDEGDLKKPTAPPPQPQAHPMDQGYPAAGGYPAAPASQTIVVTSTGFGPNPQQMTCPHCQAQVVTSVTFSAGLLAWIAAGAICLFGLWCGCCLIPFMVDSCQDAEHRCPNCNQFLGIFKRM